MTKAVWYREDGSYYGTWSDLGQGPGYFGYGDNGCRLALIHDDQSFIEQVIEYSNDTVIKMDSYYRCEFKTEDDVFLAEYTTINGAFILTKSKPVIISIELEV